jgi:sugar transferase (PEP-CTERM/EpsH1 system associated)
VSLHVVHVVYCLRVAGLENGVVNVANGLRSRFRQTVVCIEDVGPLGQRLPQEVPVIRLGKAPGSNLGMAWRLIRILRPLRPDIVHSRNWAALDAVIAARLAGVPVVIHGEHGREAFDPDGRNRRRNVIRRVMSPMIDQFVTVSADLRRWLVDVGIPARKITHISNGVETTRFCPDGRPAGRARLGLPEDAIVVGTVGRLEPVKDHLTLLEAFAALGERTPAVFLVIVGEGRTRPALEQRIGRPDLAGRVRLVGERSDVPALLNGFDVFVLSSIAEGTSNTILEAMATGLPVIATRVGGNPELVQDGVTGSLVPPGDWRRMAGALASYIDDAARRRAHGEAGRRRAVEQFSLDRMAAGYGDLYESLAARKGVARSA